MNRRGFLGLAAGLAALLAYDPVCATPHYQKSKPAMGSDIMSRCAKACSDCHLACQACAKHCQSMVSAGMKQHVKSLALSRDCADVCAAAAHVVSRKGPMSKSICEACVKACEACGAECNKYPTMKQMKECADSCAKCAAACKEMIAHA
jgi:hypothetical protein